MPLIQPSFHGEWVCPNWANDPYIRAISEMGGGKSELVYDHRLTWKFRMLVYDHRLTWKFRMFISRVDAVHRIIKTVESDRFGPPRRT